ncbi:MAG: flagellar filament capping protein FliD [Planctomycetaceae bacterium]|jgi:flagellar hook-associated protein 2|nr:flagellar filament capping protein FliD [Planctomycetaceae bacterium]
MSGIQSSVGLISGINYVDIVNQLIAIDATPINNLIKRTETLEKEQTAITELTALFMTTSYMLENLNKKAVYERSEVTSGNDSVLTVSGTASAVAGTYQFTPIRLAQSQQTLASGVVDDAASLGKTGEITIRYGEDMKSATNYELQHMNGGNGIAKGYIRITDGSGTRTTIDLRNATTINDVLDAINNNTDVDVYATLKDDKIVLTDQSGMTSSNLIVQDVNGGTTATDLGIKTTSSTGEIIGSSILYIGENTQLSFLNDGNGVVTEKTMADLIITRSDGQQVSIRLKDTHEIETTADDGTKVTTINYEKPQTLGDIIRAINSATYKDSADVEHDALIRAEIVDGCRIAIYEDGVNGGGEFKIQDGGLSPIIQSLGLVDSKNTAVASNNGDPIVSRRLIGTFSSVLTQSINGGNGISAVDYDGLDAAGVPAQILVADRLGNNEFLEFTTAEIKDCETLEQAMNMFNTKLNDAGVKLEVRMNASKSGFDVVDTTGRNSGVIVFGDTLYDTGNVDTAGEPILRTAGLAAAFGINMGETVDTGVFHGKDAGFQVMGYNTKLSTLNAGKGVTFANSKIWITDSSGKTDSLEFTAKDFQTLGDVIQAINALSVNVFASINDTGDGIQLVDRANGTSTFTVADNLGSKIAQELKISGSITTSQANGGSERTIDGSTTFRVNVEAKDSLYDIQKKINELGGAFTASTLNDGTDAPFRLSIAGKQTGSGAKMVINMDALGLSTTNLSEAQDAIMEYGSATGGGSLTLKSSSNTFSNAAPGVTVTIKSTSKEPVNVWSQRSSVDIKASLKSFVDNYNAFRDKWKEYCQYTETGEKNLLSGTSIANAFDMDVTKILRSSFNDLGVLKSLADFGLTFSLTAVDETTGAPIHGSGGKLEFDETKFDALYESNPDAIEEFFFKQKEVYNFEKKEYEKVSDGFSERFKVIANSLTATEGSLTAGLFASYKANIDKNYERATFMEARLQTKKNRMLKQFYNMEQVMAKIQGQMQYINQIGTSSSTATA